MHAFVSPSVQTALDVSEEKLMESERDSEEMRIKCIHLEEQLLREKHLLVRETALRESTEHELGESEYNIGKRFFPEE